MRRFLYRPSADPNRGRFFLIFFFLLPLVFLSCSGFKSSHKRWLSLSPSITEILFAIDAGPEVGGVCSPADYPAAAATLPRVASWQKVNVEAIVAASPEYCFTVDDMQPPRVLNTLRRLGVKVRSYRIDKLDDLFMCIKSIGDLTGHGDEAHRLVAEMKQRISPARLGLPREPAEAVIVVGLKPLVVAGENSFMDDMLKTAAFRNPIAERGGNWPQVSLETVALSKPQVIVYPGGEFSRRDIEKFLKDLNRLMDRPVHPLAIDADLLSRPRPRTPLAIEQLCAARKKVDGT